MENDELNRKHQEFLSLLEASEKELKQYEKKIAKYKKALFNFIVKLTYSYYPETLTESEQRIRKEIQFHFTNLIEDLDAPLSGFEVESKYLVNYTITHTNFEKELEWLNNDNIKCNISLDDPYHLEDIEDLKWTVTNEKYRDEIIFNSRKLLFDYFPEIENFSSNAFLQLEYATKRFAGELVVGINYIVYNDLV